MNINDLYPPVPTLIPAAVGHRSLRFLPDRYGQVLYTMLVTGSRFVLRQNCFMQEPQWLLQFRAGMDAESKECLDATYGYIIKNRNRKGIVPRFHSTTGRLITELQAMAPLLAEKKKMLSFLIRFRSFMVGGRQSFPNLPKGASNRIMLLSTNTYGMDLMQSFWDGQPLPTQDYAVSYLIPLDSLGEALLSASSIQLLELVNSYRS